MTTDVEPNHQVTGGITMHGEPNQTPLTDHDMRAGSSRKHEIGILFVHGIGEQKAGQTLVEFGEPLCKWITRWLDGAVEGWASLIEGSLVQWLHQQSEQGVPAELLRQDDPELQIIDRLYWQRGLADQKRLQLLRPLLDLLHERKQRERGDVPDLKALGERYGMPFVGARVTTDSTSLSTTEHIPEYPMSATLGIELLKVDGEVLYSSWKLAESHWAESFLPPKFLPMALWVMLVAPWTAGSYFTRRIRCQYWELAGKKPAIPGPAKSVLGSLRLCGLVLASPLALPMAFLTQLAIGLLWLVWLPPIPALRRWSGRFQQKLAAILGDAYAFADSPLREAAIIDQVMRDLSWLEERCEKVVIVAHSQGAAITYLCLRKWLPASLRLVVTFGSGLRKLEEFHRLRRPGFRMIRVTFVMAVILYAVAGQFILSFALTDVSGDGQWGWGWVAIWCVSLVFYSAILLSFSAEEENTDIYTWAEVLGKAKIRWLDIYSSADPVPNGPIFIEEANFAPSEALESLAVHNFDSMGADHTGYLRNRDEFLGTVAAAITRHTESRIPLHTLTERDQSSLEFVHRRRAWRVGYLKYARLAAALSLIALLAIHRNDLATIGAAVNANARALTSSIMRLWTDSASGFAFPVSNGILGAAAIALGVLAGWAVVYWVWLLWDRGETWQFFHRSEFARKSVSLVDGAALLLVNGWQFAFVIVCIQALWLALHFGWPSWSDPLPKWSPGWIEAGVSGVAAGLSFATAPPRVHRR